MKILITGGSGLVGQALSKALLSKGHQVHHLSRKEGTDAHGIPAFEWNLDRDYLDPAALVGVDAIVNLAGASIAERWTPEHKNAILRSRVDGTRLLLKSLQENGHQVHSILSASAVGYYPNDLERCFDEKDPPGDDFLSLVCQKWEQEAQHFEALGLRTLRMRIGIVLAREGGALAKMAQPVRLGLGAPLGSGQQWVPWIHIEDLVALFIQALENRQWQGVYNAVGPQSHTNRQLTQAIAKQLGRPLWLPPVPAWALKIGLGEMAATILASNRVSAQKIMDAGFVHRYPDLEQALASLLD